VYTLKTVSNISQGTHSQSDAKDKSLLGLEYIKCRKSSKCISWPPQMCNKAIYI